MRIARALALLALMLPFGARAQVWPAVGERVRVRHVDGRLFTGPVERTSDQALRLGGPGGPYVIDRAAIAGMERSLGERRSFGRGLITTMGIAAGGTGLVSALLWSPCRDDCFFHPRTRRDAFGWGFVGGAVLSFPLGILVGAASKTERWEALPAFGPVVLSVVRSPDVGVVLRASIPVGH